MKKQIASLILSAAVCASCVGMSGCYFFPEEEKLLDAPTIKIEDVTYSTYTAKRKTIESATIVSGYVTSKTEKQCYFTAYTGQLKTIYVKAGDFVEEGDLIAEMNTGTLDYDLEIQKLRVQLAQLNYNNSGSAADKLQLEIEQNQLDEYQAQYDGAKLYAPVSGQVSYAEKINPGTTVDPYKVLAKIVNPEELYIRAELSDSKSYVKGDKVTITVNDTEYAGTITRTPTEEKEEGDEKTNLIYADFDGAIPSFSSIGSLADIKKINAVAEDAIVIPKHLVQTLDGRTYVRLYKDGEKLEVDVTTGIVNATEIEILSGVEEGDQVVVK